MAENIQALSASFSSIPDRSMIYPEHYTRSHAYPSIPSSSSVALLTEIMQPPAKNLKELEEDFFYKGEYVVDKRTCKNIKDSNMDISLLYQDYYKDKLSSFTTQKVLALLVSITI